MSDLIDRQAAIDLFKKWQPYMATRIHEFEKELYALPPVEQKQGKWILTADKEHGRCSNCGHEEYLVDGHSSYGWCSNCGAKMCGGDTDEISD